MYRVVDWQKHFENNRTKELKRLAWVPMPNKQDGDGYTELLDHPEGAAHFGCWCAIVEVASKCDPRGTLSRQGAVPHTAASLARMTRIPTPLLETAISRLVDEIKWLEIVPDPNGTKEVESIPHSPAEIPHPLASSRVRAGAFPSLPFHSFQFPSGFMSEPLIAAIVDWARYLPTVKPGQLFDQLQLDNLLMDRRRMGWTPEKLEQAIRFSIGKGCKSIVDPDETFGRNGGGDSSAYVPPKIGGSK